MSLSRRILFHTVEIIWVYSSLFFITSDVCKSYIKLAQHWCYPFTFCFSLWGCLWNPRVSNGWKLLKGTFFGTVYCTVQGDSNFLLCGWNPIVWPFNWKLLSSTFPRYCLRCRFQLLGEILKCDYLDESYWAVLSCSTTYYVLQGGSIFFPVFNKWSAEFCRIVLWW